MSKHSMRKVSRSSAARSSASTSARVRSRCEPSSASSRASAISAPLTAISSQMRRCSRGWCCAAILTPHCSDSASQQAGVQRVAGHQRRRRRARRGSAGRRRPRAPALLGAARRPRRHRRRSNAPSRAVRREVRPVAEVAAAAHHRQVDAGAAALQLDRQDVDVRVARRQAALVHRLLVQHARQRADLVAHDRRPARTAARSACAIMRRLQRLQHGIGLAEQKALGIGDVARVVGLRR